MRQVFTRRLVTCFAVLVTVSANAEQLRTFKQNTDGNWETVVTHADGSTERYTFIPPSKILVGIEHVVSLVEPDRPTVTYRYELRNSALSRDSITTFSLLQQAQDVKVTETPFGWELAPFGPTGFFSLFGISPSKSEFFGFESSTLPGVVTAEISGVRELLEIPDGLSDRQRDELEFLSVSTSGVPLNTIGPVLNISRDSLPAATSAVLAHYKQQLELARHPYREALNELTPGTTVAAAAETALRIRQLTEKPVADRWHAKISEALGICAGCSCTEPLAKGWRSGRAGNWQTTVAHDDGTTDEFVFSPPNKFIATVQSYASLTSSCSRNTTSESSRMRVIRPRVDLSESSRA